MAITQWDERYSVGVESLDEQHSQLFTLFYKLLEVEDITQEPNKITDTLVSLRAYTNEHFKQEEEYMAQCGYPDLESHIHEHNAFHQKIDALFSAKMRTQNETFIEILSSLYEWLINHVSSYDQQYVPYAKTNTST